MKNTALFCIVVCCFITAAQAEYVADNVNMVQLTDDGKTIAVGWSYHGDTIACLKQETRISRQLMLMNPDGTNIRTISPIGNPMFAEFSWAGDKFAYEYSNSTDGESQAAVYIHDLTTGKTDTVSAPYKEQDLDADDGPVWSADDRYIAYMAAIGPSDTRTVLVYDTLTSQDTQLLTERGQSQSQQWSSSFPNRLCMQLQCSGGWDIVTANPDGSGLVQLTDIGSQNLDTDPPRWSPDSDWIAFSYDRDMTQTERDERRSDTFIALQNGNQVINLTKATSPVTENQYQADNLFWSWDGRWLLAEGDRFDIQGNGIPTLYLIDPQNSTYEILRTSNPREGNIEFFMSGKWSYDSSKILLLTTRFVVRNWGADEQFEKRKTALSILDINTKQLTDLIVFDEEQDRKALLGDGDKDELEDISFSPDNRSIILTIADIISQADEILEPDVYRLDLGDQYIGPQAAQHYGPPMGRNPAAMQTTIAVEENAENQDAAPQAVGPQENSTGIITETIYPQHMTVDEVMESLPATYAPYFTKNLSRNLLFFKGPAEVLAEFRSDLKKIDTEPPHILVDLLAVELTDEANRSLGLDWTFAQGHIGLHQPTGQSIFDLTTETALGGLGTMAGTGQVFYQGVGRLPQEFFIRLNTLVQDGKGTILANPRTVAMSGKESMIQIRKTLNYFFNEGFDVSGRPIVKKSDISADTQGRIIPTLLADGKINLIVDVKVGSFTFTPDAGLPEQINRESSTEVVVQDGQTLIIGGLRQQEMNMVKSKVPLLGDLPLLGGLFKKEESVVQHSVLTLFITPRVLTKEQMNPEWPGIDIEDINSSKIDDIISMMRAE